jgi:proline iminopeptidase
MTLSNPFSIFLAEAEERRRSLPGDNTVTDPVATITHAITINVPPERVWPWLAQMGAGRAGWYSYDRVDNGGTKSTWHLIPEYQNISRGDLLPAVPGSADAFVVASVEPHRDLVLTVPAPGRLSRVSWEFFLDPIEGGRTRLIVRGRVARHWLEGPVDRGRDHEHPFFIERVYRLMAKMPRPIMFMIAGLGHSIMQSRQLRGLKRRAEEYPSSGHGA